MRDLLKDKEEMIGRRVEGVASGWTGSITITLSDDSFIVLYPKDNYGELEIWTRQALDEDELGEHLVELGIVTKPEIEAMLKRLREDRKASREAHFAHFGGERKP